MFKSSRIGTVLLVITLGLGASTTLAETSAAAPPEKTTYLEKVELQLKTWNFRVAEVLAKRDIYPEESSEFKALNDLLADLRDKRNHATNEIEDLRDAKSDWQSHQSTIDADYRDMGPIYEKTLSY